MPKNAFLKCEKTFCFAKNLICAFFRKIEVKSTPPLPVAVLILQKYRERRQNGSKCINLVKLNLKRLEMYCLYLQTNSNPSENYSMTHDIKLKNTSDK